MTEEALINAYLAHEREQAKKYLIVDDLCGELKMEELEKIDERTLLHSHKGGVVKYCYGCIAEGICKHIDSGHDSQADHV